MFRVCCLILWGCLVVSATQAATLQVPGGYATIQTAVDSASSGDTVLVATGTYSGAGNLDITTGGKSLVIKSEHGPDSTTIVYRYFIDGEFYARCFLFDSAAGASVIEGFTLIDSADYSSAEGRALYITGSSPTIRRCVVRGFHAGSPVLCEDGSPRFDHCEFLNNVGGCSTCKAGGEGRDALWMGRASAVRCINGANATFENCDFVGNTSDVAQGALLCDASSPLLVDCRFVGNAGYYCHGAAVVAGNGSGPVFAKCSFERNRNDAINRDVFGGAVYVYNAGATFDACLFDSNATTGGSRDFGTGICADSAADVSVTGCTFTRNEGDGASGFSGVWCGPEGMVAITRSLFAFNRDCPPVGRVDSTGTVELACCDIFGNEAGDWVGDIAVQLATDSNFSANPYACDTAHPAAGLFDISPCAPANNPCGRLVGAFGIGCLNTAPVITSGFVAAAYEDSLFVYEAAFDDPDGPDTVIAFVDVPSWCNVAGDSLIGTAIEGASDTGFVLVVSDGYAADTQMVYIDVIPVNDRPVLTPVDTQLVFEGVAWELLLTASDPDGDSLVLAVSDLPSNAVFIDSGNGRGVLAFEPDSTQNGVYDILVTAADSALVDSMTLTLVVLDSVPTIADLWLEGEEDVQHVLNHEPVFVWIYADSFQAQVQTGFEIAVGLDTNWTVAELWADTVFLSSDTAVTYGGDSLVDGMNCFVRVRVDNGVAWSEWFELSFRLNSRPWAPTPLAPPDSGYASALPTLWVANGSDAEEDSLTYDFVVRIDTAAPEVDSQFVAGAPEGLDSTGWQPEDSLTENYRYVWRARAFDGFEYSDWFDSAGASFWVNDSPEPPPMSTTMPLTEGCSLTELLPRFYWSRSLDPDPLDTITYRLHLATDSAFDSEQVIGPLGDTAYTATDSLSFATEYWWKVTVEDNTGRTVQSEVSSFRTWTLGDINDNGSVAVSDLTLLIAHLFRSGALPCAPQTGDVTGDCAVNVSDLTYLIAYLFRGGPPPGVWCTE